VSRAVEFEAAMRHHRLVAILRGIGDEELPGLVDALVESGVRVIEVSLSDPGALAQVEALRRHAPAGVLVGAGTVTSARAAAEAAERGASFLVTPHVTLDVIDFANYNDLGVLCGVMTPTEAATAREAGARLLKLFPAGVLGPGYVKQLLGPYPHLELFAVGGVSSANAADFIAAGAAGVGVGGALSRPGGLADGFAAARREARALVEVVRASAPSGSST
jgi:2-dehydro-3-deoxyphosphogluconate aldolase/(4S)-4-hydroxy-2-oxoglutarate aldolase